MSLLTRLFQSKTSRYRKWRELGMHLNSQIVQTLPKELIGRAAEDLGMKGPRGVLVFDDEDETSFLMDRAIHDLKIDGRRWIEFYIEKEEARHTQDERKLLYTLRDSYYSLFQIQEVRRFQGVQMTDLLSSRSLFLTDIGLGTTLQKDYLLATRVVSVEDLHFTSGSPCPFQPKYTADVIGLLPKDLNFERQSIENWMRLNNHCFFKAMKRIGVPFTFSGLPETASAGYRNEEGHVPHCPDCGEELEEIVEEGYKPIEPVVRTEPVVGRNEPCPCGSGKKFKKCCLR